MQKALQWKHNLNHLSTPEQLYINVFSREKKIRLRVTMSNLSVLQSSLNNVIPVLMLNNLKKDWALHYLLRYNSSNLSSRIV